MEQSRRPAELLEVVGDRPVGERLGAAHGRRHAAHEVGGTPRRVVDRVEVGGVRTPLRPPLRQAGEPVPRGDRAQVERRVAVGVGAHEVDRRAGGRAMREQLVDPLAGGRCRSADDERVVDGPHRADGDVVEAQVLVARAGPEDVEVRLVPDLECPGADLVAAVALDEMRHEVADERVPAIPVARWADDGAVLEHRLRRVARRGRAA